MATPDAHQFYPEILPSATWTDLEGTVLSDICQTKTHTSSSTQNRRAAAKGRGVGGGTGQDTQKAQTSGEKINSSRGCHVCMGTAVNNAALCI